MTKLALAVAHAESLKEFPEVTVSVTKIVEVAACGLESAVDWT